MDDAAGGQVRASTLELFFDLVFVFTITQLTHSFTEHPSWLTVGRVALMFGIIWWMYSGYVWLTNEVAPDSTVRRSWLLVGMLGFFIIALAVPGAFSSTGLAFGLGYFLVNTVHSGLFYSNGGSSANSAILRFAPMNATSACLVVAGGLIHGWPRYLLWALAFTTQIVTPYILGSGGFVIRPSHFCERHGLVLIVTIGESVVAIGAGLAGRTITPGLVATVGLALGLAYVLWWAYFGIDDERGEHALTTATGTERGNLGVLAYGYSLYPMMVGIILAAAGIKLSIAHGNTAVPLAAAAALSGGVSLFFVGQYFFRLTLRLPRPWWRLVAAAAVAATTPIGVVWVAWGQLGILLAVSLAAIIADDILSIRAGDESAYLPGEHFRSVRGG